MKCSEKMIYKLVTVIITIMLVFTYISPAYATGTSSSKDRAAKLKIDSKCATVYCENTGEIVYSKNMDKKIEPFSVTKLMTALLAIQHLPLDKEVKIPYQATELGGSSMGLVAGETVTVEDLLYGAMLNSGNDACYALAIAVSGNVDDFVKLMNETAENIGCKKTRFANPHGLRDKKHYTTAYDMMLISKMAFSNETLAKISGTKTFKVKKTDKSPVRIMKTHIDLIEDDNNYVNSAKTGFWDQTHCSIAFAYEKDGLRLITVLLGCNSETRTKDCLKIIKAIASNVEGVKVCNKGVEQGKVRIKHGAKTRLEAYTKDVGMAFIPKEASESLISTKVVMSPDISAPVKKGDVVGVLEILVADELVNKVDLVVDEDVDTGWFPSYLGISNLGTIIIVLIIVLLFVLYIWMLVAKAQAKRRRKQRRKQRIMEIALEEYRREQDRKEREWRF